MVGAVGAVGWLSVRIIQKVLDRVIDVNLDKAEKYLEKKFKATLRVKTHSLKGLQITAIVENETDKGLSIDQINLYHPRCLPPKDHKNQDMNDFDWKSGKIPMEHRFQTANFNMNADSPPLHVHAWWDVKPVEIVRMIPPKELKIEIESVHGKIIVINGDELKAKLIATMVGES